jgi:hypothetical protein
MSIWSRAADLGLGRHPVQRALELRVRAVHRAGLRPHRARDPVHRAQLVDDRAADPGARVGLELHRPARLVLLDRVDQAEHPVRHQVGLLDHRGQAHADPAGDGGDQRGVVQDQPLAHQAVAAGLEQLPVLGDRVDHRAGERLELVQLRVVDRGERHDGLELGGVEVDLRHPGHDGEAAGGVEVEVVGLERLLPRDHPEGRGRRTGRTARRGSQRDRVLSRN